MIRSRWSKWLSGVVGVVLIGGLVLANYGSGVTPAEAHHDYRHGYQNPFKQILGKLNEILMILKTPNAGGGGAPLPSTGGAAGNYTMRWDTNKPSAERFTVLADFGDAAVRDNNTGLVWERSPVTMEMWFDARLSCLNKAVPAAPAVGGTRGWRLPSITELASLVDPSVLSGLRLQPGHPFLTVVSGIYWSATTSASNTSSFGTNNILSVSFDDGVVGTTSKCSTANCWCVRGPMSESVY